VDVSRYFSPMARRPAGVPHPLSWVRHVDSTPWPANEPPPWEPYDRSYDGELELAFKLARCAVNLDIPLSRAAREVGVGWARAKEAMTDLRLYAAQRRRGSAGPLSDSAIFKRFARVRKRQGRICLAPGCELPIAKGSHPLDETATTVSDTPETPAVPKVLAGLASEPHG